MPTVPNPYFIYIELVWPDGHRATQNEIAVVTATDVNAGTNTNEGQSGWDPTTGGWQPIFMQNIAIFQSRGAPNLKFDVINTQNTDIFTTGIFNNIASGSTVHIVIGQSATIVGGGTGPTTFTVTGHARKLSNSAAFFPGSIKVFDITNGSTALLGSTILNTDGSYSVSFTSDAFSNNGGAHTKPNLQVQLFDLGTGQLLTQSDLFMGWMPSQVVDLLVDDTVPAGQEHKVFGQVTNPLGLPVPGIILQAVDIVWTTTGIQEIPLGTATSDGSGNYSIIYQPPNPPGSPNNCAPAPDQINLLVYALASAGSPPVVIVASPPGSPPAAQQAPAVPAQQPNSNQLARSGVVFNALVQQQVNLVVNKIAVATDSEYTRLNNDILNCLGANQTDRYATLNLLNSRPELLEFVADSSGNRLDLVQAYVTAWLIAGDIDKKVFSGSSVPSPPPASPPSPFLFKLVLPLSAEVMYGLVRDGLGVSLSDFLSVEPDEFFNAIVDTVHQGIISASIEPKLRPTTSTSKDSLVDDWRTVLSVMLTRTSPTEIPQWQQQLLALTFPDASPTVIGNPTVTAVSSDSVTTHNVTMPSPVSAGDLLLVLFASHTAATVTAGGSGWGNPVATVVNSSSVRLTVFAKAALGTEAGTQVNFTTSNNADAVAQVIRIAQGSWSGLVTDLRVVTASGTNTVVAPPSINTAFFGSAPLSETFVIAGAFLGTATPTGANPPSNYTGFTKSTSVASPLASTTTTVMSAWRQVQSDTESPGAFNISASSAWVAVIIGVKPVLQLAKRQAVVGAHFDSQGSFDDLLALVTTNPLFTAPDIENLTFVFAMYDRVARWYPIVAATYPVKVARAFHTIADLATLTLADWITFATNSVNFVVTTGNSAPATFFPGDVPGNTNADKAPVYAQRLLDLFGGTSPQNRFVAAFTQSPPNPGLQSIAGFLQANPTFSLESSNIDLFNANALASPPTSPITAPLPAALVPQMKQLQRVYRLTNDFAASQALVANGFDSAVKISQMEEGAFIASQERFVGGLTAARNIHRTASHYANEVLFNIVKFHQNVNDAGGITAVAGSVNMAKLAAMVTGDPSDGFTQNLGGIDNAVPPDPRKLPNWTTLFGNVNTCACNCCQTVLDPGAYLVDILEFATQGPKKPLLDRRPDLQDIEITCSNTNTVLPYIDLVNETLEGAINPLSFQLPLTLTATTIDQAVTNSATFTGQVVPVLASSGNVTISTRATIATAIDDNLVPTVRVWTVTDDFAIYSIRGSAPPFIVYPSRVAPRAFALIRTTGGQLFIPASDMDGANLQEDITVSPNLIQALADQGYPLTQNATLHLSAENTTTNRVWVINDEAWMFTIRGTAPPFITFPTPQTSDDNDTLAVFPEHVTTAAYDTLSKAVFPFNLPLALGKEEANIFIGAKSVQPQEVLEAFTIDDRDTVLSKGTGALALLNLSSSEAAAILGTSASGPQFWGFDNANSVTIVRPDQPTQSLTGTWINLLTLVPVFLHRSGLQYQELLDLLDTQFVDQEFAQNDSSHFLHIAAIDTPTEPALSQCDFNHFQIAHLNDGDPTSTNTLRRLSFFIRLWRRLGWSMRDLDTYLMSLEGGNIPGTLTQISLVKRLADQLGLDARQVFAFWSDLDTRRTDRNKKSFFDEIFMVGSPGQPELVDLEQVIEGNPNIPLAGTALPNVGEDLKGHVRAALKLKAEEIDLLWPTSGNLSISMLSQIYRIATFSHAIGVSVVDYFDLVEMTGADPFPAVQTVLMPTQIIRAFDAIVDLSRVQSTSMAPGEIEYYLTDFAEVGDKFVPKREDLNAAAQRLALSVGDITTALAPNPHPDAAALSQLLAKVIPADKVVRAVAAITPPIDPNTGAFVTPPPAITATDRAFLTRYFAPFIGPNPSGFLDGLSALSDGPTRFSTVFDALNAFLVDQAQTAAVLSATSELFGTDRDTVDILLTESLSSTHGGASAMDDWKALLTGGWDAGNFTIDTLPPRKAGSLVIPWTGALVIPKGGSYRFVVQSDVPGELATVFSLSIDDGTPAFANNAFPVHPVNVPPPSPPTSPPLFGTEFIYDALTLKGGAVLNVSFKYAGAGNVSLLWQIDNNDPVIVPGTAVLPMTISAPLRAAPANASPPAALLAPVQPSEYLKLFKATRMVAGLSLTKPELQYLVDAQVLDSPPDPQVLAFSFDRLPVLSTDPDVAWTDLTKVIDLLDLNRSITFKSKTLFELWGDLGTPTIDDVANQTGWKTEDILAVETLWTTLSPPKNPPSFRDPAIWYVLRATMDIVNRLDLRAARIISFFVKAEPTAASAVGIRNAFRSQFTTQEWKDIFKPLQDPLRQKQRDALVGYLTTRPVLYLGKMNTFFDADDLYSFFLIDVQMEPDTLISRIVLAHLVIQLFVDRVFLGLEDPTSFSSIDDAKDQWGWMSAFRVWQANRQVFLFPENYIVPELRDDKTEMFQNLEDELLQNTVTDDVGNTAIGNYLEQMNEVSNLEIVGTYAEGGSLGVNGVLHVVGRTRAEPRTFYYRTFIAKQVSDGTWNPWIKIPVDIKGDVVAPVIFNGHLHLFWPSIAVKQRPDPPKTSDGSAPAHVDNDNVADEHHTTYMAEIKLMSTEYVPNQNKWLKPLVSQARAIDEDAPTPFENEVGEVLPKTDNYHLRVSAVGKDFVSIDLIKTHTPEPPTEEHVLVRTRGVRFGGFWGRGFYRFPTVTDTVKIIEHDGISPGLLGTFQFWYTGANTFEPPADDDGATLSLGTNWPVNTALIANSAMQVDIQVEGQTVKNELQLSTNIPFFERTPFPFRLFSTNFGYLGAENNPFFYETANESFFAVNKGPVTEPGFTNKKILEASFQTFNHPLVRQLQQSFHDFGTSALMSRLTEALPLVDNRYYSNYYYNYYGNLYLGYHIAGDTQALGTMDRLFEAEFDPRESVVGQSARPTNEFAYGSPFGVYNWELFFHLPIMIADRLKQNLDFETALKWYHYVFDPKQTLNTYEQTKAFALSLPTGARFWNFLPFFANREVTDSLAETLGLRENASTDQKTQLAQIIDDWRHNPFKPHLIARQRIAAYQKFVVMSYLDNLIQWGDSLFRQDSFEAINKATQLYILANDILGQKPQQIDTLAKPQQLTFRELQAKGLDVFSNAVTEVEYQIVSNQNYIKSNVLEPQNSASLQLRSIALRSFFFMIPRNDTLDGFWDTVADRLFKIRNSMNIDGVKRQLALFQPPINPALLVAAAAAGLDLSSVVAQLNTPLPHYRFTTWMQKAVDICNELKSFGAALLSALEKKDAEALQILRQTHELTMLQLARKVKEQQVREAEGNITALELSRAVAEDRRDEYHNREKVSGGEQSQVNLTIASTVLETLQGAAHLLAGILHLIPDGKVGMVGPFPLASADMKIGSAAVGIATAAGDLLGTVASLTRGLATISGLKAGFERRWQDWKLQERQAAKEIVQFNQQIAVANIRLQISQQELDNQDTQIDQSKDVLDFLKTKFTNKDLYSFMVTQLSRTFQQVYQLAYDAAKTAERTMQFELGIEDTFIQFTYQDSLHQGLLAGEKLIQDLKRMEIGYLERYKREYEIQKPISLAFLDGAALQNLRDNGVCEFVLPEVIFDLDFPGQYFRRVKAVRLTIPCVTGPHTSVSAKLTLLSSTFRKDAKAPNAKSYSQTSPDDPRFVQDPVGIQAIATSTGQSDAGLFELNFRDERYLPFEGAGVISRWRLELPNVSRQFDYQTISDVVMQLSYTAREGGGQLKTAAETNIQDRLNQMLDIIAGGDFGLVRSFSLRREFPDVFHKLLSTPVTPTPPAITMTIEPEHFPYVLRQRQMAISVLSPPTIEINLKVGASLPQGTPTPGVSITDNQQPPQPLAGEVLLGGPAFTSQDLLLTQTTNPLVLDDVEDIVVTISYQVAKPLKGM
jgi:hypothetical protein